MTTVIMRTTARTVVTLILLVAVSLFLQGHKQPGGGFIGGVLATTAFALVYVAYDLYFLEERVLGRELASRDSAFGDRTVGAYLRLFAVGIALAAVAGLVPLAFGLPYLSQTYVVLEGLPIYHELEVASALAFDLGVFCVVVGAILTVISVVGAE